MPRESIGLYHGVKYAEKCITCELGTLDSMTYDALGIEYQISLFIE